MDRSSIIGIHVCFSFREKKLIVPTQVNSSKNADKWQTLFEIFVPPLNKKGRVLFQNSKFFWGQIRPTRLPPQVIQNGGSKKKLPRKCRVNLGGRAKMKNKCLTKVILCQKKWQTNEKNVKCHPCFRVFLCLLMFF